MLNKNQVGLGSEVIRTMCSCSVGDTCRETQEGKEIKNEFINLTPSESMSLAFNVQIITVWFVFSLKCISIFPDYLMIILYMST